VLGVSDNPVISLAVSVNVLAGITAIASGGFDGRRAAAASSSRPSPR
jgi:hypothetical protein